MLGLAVFGVVALILGALIAVTAGTGSGDWAAGLADFIPGDWRPRRRK